MKVAVLAIAVAVFGLTSGCFKTPQPDCAFLCGAGGSCPTDYFCAEDGVCKRDGIANTFDCGFVAPPDAGIPVDAPIGIDAAPDAPPDAAPDAGLDAGVDAS